MIWVLAFLGVACAKWTWWGIGKSWMNVHLEGITGEWEQTMHCERDGSRVIQICSSGGWFGAKDCKVPGQGMHSQYQTCMPIVKGDTTERQWAFPQSSGWDAWTECDIEKGYTAVATCNSGTNKDCSCQKSDLTGCKNSDSHKNLMMCAKGVYVDPEDTEEKCTPWNGFPTCSSDYVMYSMCTSGNNKDCKDKDNNWVVQCIKCVKVVWEKHHFPQQKDDAPPPKVRWLTPKWVDVETGPNLVVTTSLGVTTTEGEEETTSVGQTVEFGSNAEFSSSATGKMAGLGEVTNTFSFGVHGSVSKETIDMTTVIDEIATTENKEVTRSCGKDVHTLWQLAVETVTDDGYPGPDIRLEHFVCLLGSKDRWNPPRCWNGECVDPSDCTICYADRCLENGDYTKKWLNDTFNAKDAAEYRGCQSYLPSGAKCQPWGDDGPVKRHKDYYQPKKTNSNKDRYLVEDGLHKNFCRDPKDPFGNHWGQLWCYSKDATEEDGGVAGRWGVCEPRGIRCNTNPEGVEPRWKLGCGTRSEDEIPQNSVPYIAIVACIVFFAGAAVLALKKKAGYTEIGVEDPLLTTAA